MRALGFYQGLSYFLFFDLLYSFLPFVFIYIGHLLYFVTFIGQKMSKQRPLFSFPVFWYIPILLFLFPIVGISQHDQLLQIIESGQAKEGIENSLDQFFKDNESRLNDRELADCYHDVGSQWYYANWWNTGSLPDLEKAIDYTKKALDIKKNLDNLPVGSLEKTAYNLGAFHHLKGEVFKAEKAYLFLLQKGNDPEKIENAKVELGNIYLEIGDFYKALEQFDEIIISNNSSTITENFIDAHIIKAEIFSLMGIAQFSEEIRTNLSKADSLLKLSGISESYYNNRINQTQGNRLIEIGDYENAIKFHKRVLSDSLNLYPNELARVYNSLGFSEIKLRRFDLAEKYLQTSIDYDPDYSLPYENLGDLYMAKKDFDKAMYNYQKAIYWSVNKSDPVEVTNLPSLSEIEVASEKIFLLNHLVTKANGWLRFYEVEPREAYLQYALSTFRLSDRLIDLIRNESTENQSKYFWREKGANLYSKAVEVCYLLDLPEAAYYFMERNKALLLMEDISAEQAKEMANLPQDISEREFKLKQNIYLSENELRNFEPTSGSSLDSVRQRVYESKRIYNTFADSLATAFPDYVIIKKQAHLLPYENFISDYISENEAVLQYILNEEQGYGLLTSRKQSTFFKLENVKKLNESLIQLYSQLTDLTTNRDELTHFNTLSHQIFNQLVPETVHGTIKGKKLTLITDYILQQIPFETLVTDPDGPSYLIEDTEIRYAYSMSYLNAKKQVSDTAENQLLAIAPVTFTRLGLPELVFSASEVEEALKVLDGKRIVNREASKAQFLQYVNDYGIVHLSTHADIGEDSDPWIAFSDQKMFLNEVYATKNRADMVVLSACNTSIGELKKGEGAMSLARGFFHSGAKSVVSSLWSTNDKSSKELMVAFYRGLEKGLTKSAALRKAKLDYIERYRGSTISPAYWGALIVIGDDAPIMTSDGPPRLIIWAALGLILVLGLYFVIKRRKASP